MKSFKIIVLIIIFSQFGQVFAQTNTTRTRHGDTLIEVNVDTTNKFIKLRKDYIKNDQISKVFSSRFINKAISPGNNNDALYRGYISKGLSLSDNVKKLAVISLKSYAEQINATDLKDIQEINACTFVPIPVYYLTHNIANFTNQINLTSFFTLDTSNITYKIIRNGHVDGIVQYQKGRCFFWHFNGFYSRAYNHIVSLHKEPLIFVKTIADPKYISTNQYDGFGYVSKGNIIFVTCSEGENTAAGPDSKANLGGYTKRYLLQSAEAYYLGSDKTLPNLGHIINNEYNRLQRNK